MPVFNDVAFIEESIKSLLSQSFTDFQLIISDDQSTDGSDQICKKYAELDDRVKYIRQPKNLGISKNMKFLLNQANTSYFMWAADDDLWDSSFLEKLVNTLEKNPSYLCAFSTFCHIDSAGDRISEPLNFDYEDISPYNRLKKLIINPFDAFGYGLFKTKEIKEVTFPVWVWPNKRISWNNIYPTLCYYLAKGNYKNVYDEPLFFNRVKLNVNHSIDKKTRFSDFFSFSIRRINLCFASLKRIQLGANLGMSLRLSPLLLKKWGIVPIYYKLKETLSKKRT